MARKDEALEKIYSILQLGCGNIRKNPTSLTNRQALLRLYECEDPTRRKVQSSSIEARIPMTYALRWPEDHMVDKVQNQTQRGQEFAFCSHVVQLEDKSGLLM